MTYAINSGLSRNLGDRAGQADSGVRAGWRVRSRRGELSQLRYSLFVSWRPSKKSTGYAPLDNTSSIGTRNQARCSEPVPPPAALLHASFSLMVSPPAATLRVVTRMLGPGLVAGFFGVAVLLPSSCT